MNIKKLYFGFYLLLLSVHLIKPYKNEYQQKITNSIIQNLFIKNFIVIKYPSWQIDMETISYIKFLSRTKTFSSFLTNDEMSMKIKNSDTFSKTIILLNEENLFESIHQLLTINEYNSRRYIWLVWSEINENLINIYNGTYIPYHAQFLIAKNISKENFEISEIYHPHVNSSITFKRLFGKWRENQEIQIANDDFYQRRFNMNGTILAVKFLTVS